ncbi:hypothetical protein O0L34_g11398 [Tuta absoluta]|nr:hypothetical protein O0L34_g11398 [Tuta absoluta]
MQVRVSSTFIFLVLIGLAVCDDDTDAKIRYYYGEFSKYTELPIATAERIFKTDWYNSSRHTVLFAHGFTGRPEGPAVAAVIKAYLEQDESNVALLNWEHLAAPLQANLANAYLARVAPNARALGYRMANVFQNLSAAGLDLNRTHLVGHSLGAQIFGIAGNQLLLMGIQLPWITGLDPAGVAFEGRPPQQRLSPKSAKFVAVLHSDPSRYGFSRQLGTVDFWPNYRNGAVRQPGCDNRPHPMFSPEDLCNHNRCWQLLVDSLKYPGTLLGSWARNYRTWKNYSFEDRNAKVLDIAKSYNQYTPGNYYFVTKDVSPYGLGREGI